MRTRIDGKKINLRKISKRDAQSICENVRDKEISRYTLLPHPYQLEDALRFIRSSHHQTKKSENGIILV